MPAYIEDEELDALTLSLLIDMVLFAMSLMLLLMALLWELSGQLPIALLAEAEALSVREDALPLVHDALSQDCIELPVVDMGAAAFGSLVVGVDCAWVSAGMAVIAVIKAAVAAMGRKAFIWSVLEEAEGGTLDCAHLMPLVVRTWPLCRGQRVKLP